MYLQQIRNATIFLCYGGKKFLIDPVLAPKGSWPPFPNSIRQDQNNPLVDLPVPIDELLKADAYIITHLHTDHFDEWAQQLIPKNATIFIQNTSDQMALSKKGFKNLHILDENTSFYGVHLIKTPGQHGRGTILLRAGKACGIVFCHPTEKTVYIAGDTVWYKGVAETIRKYSPKVIVANTGANRFLDSELLIMGKEDIYKLWKAVPTATLIASHMEAVNHWTLSRKELSDFALKHNFSERLLIPDDGQGYSL